MKTYSCCSTRTGKSAEPRKGHRAVYWWLQCRLPATRPQECEGLSPVASKILQMVIWDICSLFNPLGSPGIPGRDDCGDPETLGSCATPHPESETSNGIGVSQNGHLRDSSPKINLYLFNLNVYMNPSVQVKRRLFEKLTSSLFKFFTF